MTAAPLPVDNLQLGLAPVSADLPALYDAADNLVQVTLAVGGSAALSAYIFRAGIPIWRIPYSLASSSPSVARTDSPCRPSELDPGCSVYSNWGWVSGMAPGEAQITFTVRNMQASFLVKVL